MSKIPLPASTGRPGSDDPFVALAQALRAAFVQVSMEAAIAALNQDHHQRLRDVALLSPRQVGRLAKVADADVYSALKNGSLKATKRGSRWQVSRADAEMWVKTIKRV